MSPTLRPVRRLLPLALLTAAAARAATLTPNDPNPGTGEDLVINTSMPSLTVAQGVTISASGLATNYALHFVYPGSPITVGKVVIAGTVVSASDAGFTNRQLNTLTEVLVTPTGRISGGWYGLYNEWNNGTIGTLTNLGSISSILNEGVFGTVNNFQNSASTDGVLQLSGNVPANYNVIVRGDTYGQVRFGGGGSMTFGIFAGDVVNGLDPSTLRGGVYQDVLANLDEASIANPRVGGAITGAYGDAFWRLIDTTYRSGSPFDWDLLVLDYGNDLAEPQRALLAQRHVVMRGALDYDCTSFGPDGYGLSVRGRYSNFGDDNEVGGVLTVAKRLADGFRAGAFLDRRGTERGTSGLRLKTGSPLFGLFVGYSGSPDGTGLQARLSVANERAWAEVTRLNLAGSALDVTARAPIDTFGVSQRLGWGFALAAGHTFTPYVAVRHVESARSAYTEAYQPGAVEDPFAYGRYLDRRTTGAVGFDFAGSLGAGLTYHLGAGYERDFSSRLGAFTLAGDSLSGSYDSAIPAREGRWSGSLGLGHDLGGGRSLSLDGTVAQPDLGNDAVRSVFLGYHARF